MADTLIQSLMIYLHDQQEFPKGVKALLVLENGVVLRGQIVSPDQFMIINQKPTDDNSKRAQTIADVGLQRTADGSWPPGFTYPQAANEPPSNYVHLIDVEFMTASGWVASSTARIPTRKVIALGDQW